MNRKVLKITSWVLMIVGFTFIVPSTFYMFYCMSIPSQPNSWDDLGKFFIAAVTIGVYILNSPLVISGIGTLRYLKGKNTYKLSMIFNIIGIILYGLFLFLFVYLDIIEIFADDSNQFPYAESKIKFSIITFVLFACPLIINMIGLYKEKNNLTYNILMHRHRFILIGIITIILIIICCILFRTIIISTNKIEITENNVYSYSDFKSQLESRNLIYELPKDKSNLTGQNEITALDSSRKHGYDFSSGSYTDFSTLSVNTPRKFPMFVYDSYASLIKKSDKTAEYYYIGPEDWYITWNIYYINGKIYAAIGDESEYGSSWHTSLSTTKYGIVVSEEEDITIYNSKNNYYVKGGGILDTSYGSSRIGFPTTTDIYNNKCMKIKVVDEVNAKTLDEIAKELSPQYWKVYKSNK